MTGPPPSAAHAHPKPSSPCHCLNVRRASRAVSQFYDQILAPSALTIAQVSLLRHLDPRQPTTVQELARRLRIDRTTLNRNLKPLAEGGLVTSHRGADARTRQIQLTETGRRAVARASALWGEAQESLRAYLGATDLAALETLMSRLEALVP